MNVSIAPVYDAGLLHDICTRAYSENFAHHWYPGGLDYYLGHTFAPHLIAAELKGDDVYYFVAFVDGEPAGFMKIKLFEENMEVDKLYMLPAYKGRKIGQQFMQLAVKMARDRGYTEIILFVLAVNTPAIGFYEHWGFQKVVETRLIYPYFRTDMNAAWKMLYRVIS
jgi:GNAT superfamily N-acetyltransferase